MSAGGVDQLIERGLERYGAGDVDGALMAWEEALGLDPDDLRAAAYVDYVRENYEMLQSAPSPPDVDVPFGLSELGSADVDAYDVEVTQDEIVAAKVERYIESVDEGWFLDDEPSSMAKKPAPAPAPAPRAVAVHFNASPEPIDLGPAGALDLEADPAPAARGSRLQLPLSAASDAAGADDEAEVTLEMEADEPELDPFGVSLGMPMSLDDEQTRDFVAGPSGWLAPPPTADLDFSDPRAAVPTKEMTAPTGFVRARPEGLAPAIPASVLPMVARGPKPLTQPPVPDLTDDDLATRPGLGGGKGTADPLLDRVGARLSADALSEFGGPGTGTGRAGPDDLTRDLPAMRVRLPVESMGELDLEPNDEERTTERSSLGGSTIDRSPRHTTPPPIDEAHEGAEPSGRHPPLVIIEDPVLSAPVAESRVPTADLPSDVVRSRRPTDDELNPGTARIKKGAVAKPAPPPSPTPVGPGHEALAATLETAVEAAALPDESRADRTRRRVTDLIDRAVAASVASDHATAIVALDIALAEDPESAVAQKLIHRHQPAILDVYQRYLGDLGACPALAMPMHELAGEKLDIRAAFLLSRIDGTLTFEEILDVSGMQRPEAFRHLSILLLRGILEVR